MNRDVNGMKQIEASEELGIRIIETVLRQKRKAA